MVVSFFSSCTPLHCPGIPGGGGEVAQGIEHQDVTNCEVQLNILDVRANLNKLLYRHPEQNWSKLLIVFIRALIVHLVKGNYLSPGHSDPAARASFFLTFTLVLPDLTSANSLVTSPSIVSASAFSSASSLEGERPNPSHLRPEETRGADDEVVAVVQT